MKGYREYEESGKAVGHALGMPLSIFAVIMIGVAVMLVSGCRSIKYVPVETARMEYKEADTAAIYNRLLKLFESSREKETRSDSLFDRFKETIVLKENGDTARYDRERIVYRATNREKELELKVQRQDSVINALTLHLASIKSDTIREPYPIEKQLTRWEQTKMDYGGMAIGVIVVLACVAVIWLTKRISRKT